MAAPGPASQPGGIGEGYPVPNVPTSLRVPLIVSLALGALAVLVSGLLGHILFGVLFVAGLALGLLNIRLVQQAVSKVTADDHPSKRKMAVSSAARLVIITAIALVIGFLLKPEGIGVFAGLAVFQVVLVLSTTVPVMKGLRQQS